MGLRRRDFVKTGAGMAIATGLFQLPLNLMSARRAQAQTNFGPLITDPMNILDLPAGFSYRMVEQQFQRMSDGLSVPTAPDGMACFTGADGNWVLMRNHELTSIGGPLPFGTRPSGIVAERMYRPEDGLLGGVTRVVIDPVTGNKLSSNLVLMGTARNCAGGRSPWGWITCEEYTTGDHGYAFLCDVNATEIQPYNRIDAYGRFYKEAACIDTRDNAAYLTEDQGNGCVYRFLPDNRDMPFGSGRLQALAVVGMDRLRMSNVRRAQGPLDIRWIDCSTSDEPAESSILAGAAIFNRGEGCDADPVNGHIYICTTNGGPADKGQIFKIVPTATGGTIEVACESPSSSVLDSPDNILFTPWGDVMMCEDGDRPYHLRGCDASGQIYDFARTTRSEFAGFCFSPDGRAAFVNIQGFGATLMIVGPWPELMNPTPFVDGGMPPADAGMVPNVDSGASDAGMAVDAVSAADAAPPPSSSSSGSCAVSPGTGSSVVAAVAIAAAAAAAVRVAGDQRDDG